MSNSSISRTASNVLSSSDNTRAGPCRFPGKSESFCHIFISFNKSSSVLHFHKEGGVFELFEAIITIFNN